MLRQHAGAAFQAGVAAADPYAAVVGHLHVADACLAIGTNPMTSRQGRWSKIHLIAFGKAACRMAEAARDALTERFPCPQGLIVTNRENAQAIDGFETMLAGHPLPDADGLQAAARVVERVTAAQTGELVLALISGGGSALLPCPVAGVRLDDKIRVTQSLLACGADIAQINCVRKHLSRLKGGGLARLAAPADVHALILSDVLGDDLSAIASGPTVADPSTFAAAIAILRHYDIWAELPATVKNHLQQGADGLQDETVKPNDPLLKSVGQDLIGSNAISLHAVEQVCRAQGYQTQIFSQQLCGEARREAAQLAEHCHQLSQTKLKQPTAILAGGETTVTLQGTGLGGRNQELALAFALSAERIGLTGSWTFLSGGSDGRDGPTDAAGGMVDPQSLQRMRQAGINPAQALDNNDSYHALRAADDLLITGATGTNVADLQIVLLHPNE